MKSYNFDRKFDVLVIGPQLSSVGGMESYIRDLNCALENNNIKIIPIKVYVMQSFKLDEFVCKLSTICMNLFRIINLSTHNSYTISHIHTSSHFSFLESSMYIFLIKIIFKKLVILHIHAPDFDIFFKDANYFKKSFIKNILTICDSIIVLSSYWEKIVSTELNNKDKLFIVFNSANNRFKGNINISQSREKLNLPSDKKIILSVGNLTERKGFQYLIRSVNLLIKERTDILCVICGTGKLKDELKALINQLNLNNYVRLEGYVPDDTLNLWMNSADIIVLPSSSEGSPIVMFEALSAGKPFIGTNVGGIPDIIISDNYGYLVKPGDIDDLKKKIKISLNKNWDSNAIKNYAKQFDWNMIAQKIIDIYILCNK